MSYKPYQPEDEGPKRLIPPGKGRLRPGLRRGDTYKQRAAPVLRPALQTGRRNGVAKSAHGEIPFTGIPAAGMGSTGGTIYEGILTQKDSPAQFWGMLLLIIITLVWGAGMVVGYQTSLAVLFGLGLVLAAVGLISPALGLLAIGMLCASDAVANIYILTGGLFRFNTLNYWLIIVIALYLPFVLRLRDLTSRTLQILIVVLALYLVLSTDLDRGVQDVLNLTATFGLVVYFARSLRDPQAYYWLGVVNGFLAGLGGLIFFLQFDILPYANPNDWTYFHLTALFSICIAYPYGKRLNKSKTILLLLAAINFAWVFLSASRGSIAVALLCIAYLFLATRSITWSSLMIIFAIIVGVWISTSFVEQRLYAVQRIQLLLDPTQSEARRTSQRSIIMEAGLAIFRENPLGIGTGSFIEASEETMLLERRRPAHSAWIKTLAENGIPGIIFMTAFTLSFALNGLRQNREGMLLFGVFISLALITAFVAKEFRGKSLWFLTASGIALLNSRDMIAFLSRKLKPTDLDHRLRLLEIRFGKKRR